MSDVLLEFEQPVIELENQIRELELRLSEGDQKVLTELKALKEKCDTLKEKVYSNLTPWQRVQLARHPKRPYLKDYIPRLFEDFMELHGDRLYGDDAALLGGMAFLGKTPVMIVGHRKGRTLQESLEQNFGMPHPEGYRKSLRLMNLAVQFKMPILCFVDTAGAYPGIGAEERGQAEAIARNLREMASLPVPIIVTVLGEGGSGGALAIGVGDVVLMLENAWYSVISPEGCAAILFHDASKAEVAAQALKLTAEDLKQFGVIDEIIPEPLGGAHRDPDVVATELKQALSKHLKALLDLPPQELLENRFKKFRSIGEWHEKRPASSAHGKKKPNQKQQSTKASV